MAKICPTCQGTQVNCATCGLPPKRLAPKMSLGNKLSERLYSMGAVNWEVQGVDLSKWNGTMDLRITKTKAQYGKLRYGYGTQWKDPSLDNYYQQAQANDWPVGGYWFCQIGTDVNLSMKSFAEEIATHRPQVGITLDAEQTTLDPGKTLKWLEDAWQIILGLTNIKAEIYTAPWFWNPKVARSSFWSGKEHWCANWTTRDTPVLSLDWYNWIHWQYSGDNNGKGKEYGMVSGGDADMDLNRFNGTCSTFNARYGTHIVPIGVVPPVVPPGTLPEYVIINTGELAIRNAPSLSASTIGHALFNTKWYPLEEVLGGGVKWYRVGNNAFISANYVRLP